MRSEESQSEKRRNNDAKSWVLSLACQSPRDHGYANEVWSYSLLVKQVQKDCMAQGYPGLQKAGIKPHKISYYPERRDEEFDRKMAEVLVVNKEVEMYNAPGEKEERKHVTISYDDSKKPKEKVGIRRIQIIFQILLFE